METELSSSGPGPSGIRVVRGMHISLCNNNAEMLSRLPLATTPTGIPVPGDTFTLLETLQSSLVIAKLINTWINRDPMLSSV